VTGVVSRPRGSRDFARDGLRVVIAPASATSRAADARFARAAGARFAHPATARFVRVASRPVILRAVAGSTRAVALPRSRA